MNDSHIEMSRRRVLAMIASACVAPMAWAADPVDPAVVKAIAPTGSLRASINLGNPILANRDKSTGTPVGVSVDLAGQFASRLGVPLQLVVFDAAGKSVDAVGDDKADIGFFAIDPLRGESIAFTHPYVLIEGSYMVRDDSPVRANDEVDRDGLRIVVGKGSAYDLFLTRELKHATLQRAPTSPLVTDTFVKENADVAAGVRQQLEADARRVPGLRLLDGRFMVIEQAMGLPRRRGRAASDLLTAFVEEMKANDFVSKSLALHRIEGALVAPPFGTL